MSDAMSEQDVLSEQDASEITRPIGHPVYACAASTHMHTTLTANPKTTYQHARRHTAVLAGALAAISAVSAFALLSASDSVVEDGCRDAVAFQLLA